MSAETAKKLAAALKQGLVDRKKPEKVDEAVSKRAVKLIAQELDTGRSRMSEVPRKVRDASRASLPDKVTVWRSVALHSENPGIRPETGVVSTTRSPRVAMNMATNYPVLMGKDKFIAPKPAILRYEVPRERVHAYVPGMIDQARADHGDELKKMKITGRRSYQRMSVHDVFDQTHREDEVLADVSGLTPEVLHFHGGEQVADQEHMHAIHDLVQGRAQGSGAEYIDSRKKYGTYFRDEPKAAQEYDDFFKKARHHFRESVNEAVLRPFRCSCGHSWVDEDTPSGRACHACSGGKGKPFVGESVDQLIRAVLEGDDDWMLDKGIFDLNSKAKPKSKPKAVDHRPLAKCSECGKRHRLRPAFMPGDDRPDAERVKDTLCFRCERTHRASMSND